MEKETKNIKSFLKNIRNDKYSDAKRDLEDLILHKTNNRKEELSKETENQGD